MTTGINFLKASLAAVVSLCIGCADSPQTVADAPPVSPPPPVAPPVARKTEPPKVQEKPVAEESSTSSPSTDEPAMEYKMASINAGGRVDSDDPTIARFRTALDQIELATSASETTICDCLVKAREIEAERGKDESLLSITEATVKATKGIPKDSVKINDIIATYVVLRGNGPD